MSFLSFFLSLSRARSPLVLCVYCLLSLGGETWTCNVAGRDGTSQARKDGRGAACDMRWAVEQWLGETKVEMGMGNE